MFREIIFKTNKQFSKHEVARVTVLGLAMLSLPALLATQVQAVTPEQNALIHVRINQVFDTHPERWVREDVRRLADSGDIIISVMVPAEGSPLSNNVGSVGITCDAHRCVPNLDLNGGWILNPTVPVSVYQEFIWHEAVHLRDVLFSQLPLFAFDPHYGEQTDPEVLLYYVAQAELRAYLAQAEYDLQHGINCDHEACLNMRELGLASMAVAVVENMKSNAPGRDPRLLLNCSHIWGQAAADFIEQHLRNAKEIQP